MNRGYTPALQASWPPGTRLLDLDNARIRVRDVGSGPKVIVLTPDAPVLLENYSELIELLAPHARVICLEFPGCGFSYPRWGFRFTLDDYVEVLSEVLNLLACPAATLAFTCVNAWVALAFTKRYPHRVKTLALAQIADTGEMTKFLHRIDLKVAGIPVFQTPVLGQAIQAMNQQRIARLWFGAALPSKKERDAVWSVSQPVYEQGAQFCLASIMQGLRGIDNEQMRVENAPATVVWGDRDRTHQQTDKASIKRVCGHAKVIHFAQQGHCPDIESPRAYRDFLLDGIVPEST